MNDTTAESQIKPIDLLSLIADDHQVVTYRPRWNSFTGGVTQTLFLQQIVYWWVRAGRRPFYKFARPCAHRLYRSGDSWEEELAMNRREFETARSRISGRTRGDVAPGHLISFWVDAQRVTWYALNESLLLQHLAGLYPPSGAAAQLPLADELMDETYIRSNARNAHQPAAELMDDPYISSNARNVHLLMDDPSISSDGRNVHLLYSENEITSERSPETTTAAPAAEPDRLPAAAAVAPDPPAPLEPAILRWIGFGDHLTERDRPGNLDPPTLLAWAYWVHLEEAKPTRPKNAIALARSQWRKGLRPRDDLLALARSWIALPDDGRRALLEALDFSARYGADDPGLDDEFPGLPVATAVTVYRATGGELAPPALSPPFEATAKAIAGARAHERPEPIEPTSTPRPNATLWREALKELEMQMTRGTFAEWLRGTTAAETPDGLRVFVRNAHAADWLENRLAPLIQRTVSDVAGRPIDVHYEVAVMEGTP